MCVGQSGECERVCACVHVCVEGGRGVFLVLSRTLCVQEMAVTSSGINH